MLINRGKDCRKWLLVFILEVRWYSLKASERKTNTNRDVLWCVMFGSCCNWCYNKLQPNRCSRLAVSVFVTYSNIFLSPTNTGSVTLQWGRNRQSFVMINLELRALEHSVPPESFIVVVKSLETFVFKNYSFTPGQRNIFLLKSKVDCRVHKSLWLNLFWCK